MLRLCGARGKDSLCITANALIGHLVTTQKERDKIGFKCLALAAELLDDGAIDSRSSCLLVRGLWKEIRRWFVDDTRLTNKQKRNALLPTMPELYPVNLHPPTPTQEGRYYLHDTPMRLKCIASTQLVIASNPWRKVPICIPSLFENS